MKPIVLSLFDYTGEWAKPFIQYGYSIYTHDIKMPTKEYMYPERIHIHGNILSFNILDLRPDIILAACPCTDFALSGARWFKEKDLDGRTARSVALVKKTLEIIQEAKPRVWALENPMSRIHKLVPELGQPLFKFHPYQFGANSDPIENHRKLTWLWGDFKIPRLNPVTPETVDENGHGKIGKVWNLPRDQWQEVRSATPKGFASAFAEANHL